MRHFAPLLHSCGNIYFYTKLWNCSFNLVCVYGSIWLTNIIHVILERHVWVMKYCWKHSSIDIRLELSLCTIWKYASLRWVTCLSTASLLRVSSWFVRLHHGTVVILDKYICMLYTTFTTFISYTVLVLNYFVTVELENYFVFCNRFETKN